MSGNYGRKIVTDGLVGLWDFKNPRSYAGEPTENLVTNPDFKNELNNWNISLHNSPAYNHDIKIVDVSDGPIGDKAIYIKKEEITNDGYIRIVNPFFTANEGDTITFSGYVKCIQKGKGAFRIRIQYGVSTKLAATSNPDLQGWQRISNIYTVPQGEGGDYRLYLDFTQGTDGVVLAQGVQAEKKPYATPFTPTERLAVNGLKELSGNSNHGDLSNISFDENGMVFDGVNDNYITIPNQGSITGYPFTMCCWCKPNVTDRRAAFSILQYDGSNRYFSLGTVGGEYKFRARDSSSGQEVARAIDVIQGEWVNLVGVAQSSNNRILYVNGENVAVDTAEVPFPDNINQFLIGKQRHVPIDSGHGPLYWNGEIELPMIYNRALSPSEVKNNYNQLKGRFI